MGSTAYRPGGLLFRTTDENVRVRAHAELTRVMHDSGCRVDMDGAILTLISERGGRLPDPWALLTALRQSGDSSLAKAVGLDHLLTMAEQVGGNPFAIGHGRPGLDQYGVTGYAGRGPVAFRIPTPVRGLRGNRPPRRPRVVVLDTGIGEHPWFLRDPARTQIKIPGRRVGPAVDPNSIVAAAADREGLIPNPMSGALGTHSGHGTFIAGLIRQTCPEAKIVALAVMGSDGIVPETSLTDALDVLVKKETAEPGWIDAVVLSLGYYSETAEDLSYSSGLESILLQLGRLGVAVFCAAGNDATSRPSYPAAFARGREYRENSDIVPLSSVAALNPDGTLAAFSNYGSWVTAAAPGVNLVSAAPIVADGSDRAPRRLTKTVGRGRSGPDPDDFHSGFASWSGTSFAAPVLAGRYLNALIEAGMPAEPPARRQLIRQLDADRRRDLLVGR